MRALFLGPDLGRPGQWFNPGAPVRRRWLGERLLIWLLRYKYRLDLKRIDRDGHPRRQTFPESLGKSPCLRTGEFALFLQDIKEVHQ